MKAFLNGRGDGKCGEEGGEARREMATEEGVDGGRHCRWPGDIV